MDFLLPADTRFPQADRLCWGSRTRTGSRLPAPASKRRILYIDDDASTRRAAQLVLSRHGYDVELAADGDEGWAALCASEPDLLITDHQMPRLTGFGLIQKIRRASMTVPVILASGSLHELPEAELQRLGCRALLAKPISPAELLSAVDEALGLEASTSVAPFPLLRKGQVLAAL